MVQEGSLKYYRLLAGLSVSRLAGLAGVSRDTLMKAERGEAIQDVKAFSIIQALNGKLPLSNQAPADLIPTI
jgi:transcriptional regulator with XRE-family HTH domain